MRNILHCTTFVKNTKKYVVTYRVIITNLLHNFLYFLLLVVAKFPIAFIGPFRELSSPSTYTAHVVTFAEGGQEFCPKHVGEINNE